MLLKARKLIKYIQPHIIHSHRFKENLLAFLSSRSKGIKLFSTQHGLLEIYSGFSNLKSNLFFKLNIFLVSKFFQKFILVSHDMKSFYKRKYFFSEKKLAVVFNGIAFSNLKSKKRNGDLFVIGSAGRFVPIKDYQLLINIARLVCKENKKIVFQLAGEGTEENGLRKLIQKCNLFDNFKIRGFIDNMSEFYQSLDLYMNTSLHEGIPMTILEAMSFSVPVVAPNVGGIIEIIDNEVDGYLIRSRDPQEFCNKCIYLSNNDAVRTALGRAARQKILTKFSAERMAQKYYGLYKNSLN